MVKKHLIFSFFIPDDYETNIAIRMHYACLLKYSYLFDSAEFFIASTEGSKKYVNSVKLSLVNIFPCKDIRIKEIENDLFYESRVLKDYVIDRLDEFKETMIFFGHTKGTNDVTRYGGAGEDGHFLKWIYGLYFYSLEFIGEAERKLFTIFHGRHHTFFGSFPTIDESDRCFLAGDFYWINPMALKKDIETGEVKISEMWDRAYAEDLPTIYERKLINGYVICKSGGHNCIESKIWEFDFYDGNFDDIIMHYGDYDLFMDGYNKLLSSM